MFKVGYMCSEGVGTERDESEAIRMFRMSAVAGVPEAQFKMATLARDGKVPGGLKVAASWYSSASDQGFMPATFNLATMLYEGDGVDKDLGKAFELYSRVAETGDGDALFMVGRMYFEGIGVEKDQVKGFEFFGRAATAGNALAMELLDDIRRRQNTQFVRIDGT